MCHRLGWIISGQKVFCQFVNDSNSCDNRAVCKHLLGIKLELSVRVHSGNRKCKSTRMEAARYFRKKLQTRKTCPKIGLDFLLNIFGLTRFTARLHNVNMRLRSPKRQFARSFKCFVVHILADCIRNASLNPEVEALSDRSD